MYLERKIIKWLLSENQCIVLYLAINKDISAAFVRKFLVVLMIRVTPSAFD